MKDILNLADSFDPEWAEHLRWVNITALIAVLLLLLVMKAILEQHRM